MSFCDERERDLTAKQRDKIQELRADYGDEYVKLLFKPFELPEGYVGVLLKRHGLQVYGGIDTEGVMST